jgi:hypothetical protein
MLVAGAIAFSPESSAKKIPYDARIGAKFPIGGKGEQIVVNPFQGQDGAEFALVLQARMQSAELDGKQILNLASDRPDVLVEGAVLISRVTRTGYQKKNRTCVEDGDKWYKCNRWEESYVDCEKFNGSFSVSVKATNTSDSRLIFSQNVQQQGEYATCADGSGEKTKFSGTVLALDPNEGASTPSDLLAQLRLRSAQAIRELVAPYNQKVYVEFMRGTQGISKDAVKKYQSGMEFITAGRLDRGCSALQEVYGSGESAQSIVLNYNLGVCNEALLPDDPTIAFDFYNKADQLLTKPNKDVTQALNRLKDLIKQSSKIP